MHPEPRAVLAAILCIACSFAPQLAHPGGQPEPGTPPPGDQTKNGPAFSTPQPESDASPPAWHANRDLPAREGFLYGYGQGDSPHEAAARAMNDIALQIRAAIKSNLRIEEGETGGQYLVRTANRIEQSTQLELFGAKLLKQQQTGDLYYSAYSYDNRSLRARALQQAQSAGQTAAPNINSFKDQLPIARFLKNNNHPARFILETQNSLYYLSIGPARIPISPAEFRENFITDIRPHRFALEHGTKDGLSVPHLPPGTLAEGQLYRVSYTPAASGYLSLLYIDNTGLTQTWLKNQPVRADTPVTFPSPDRYDGLIAARATVSGTSIDMVLAIESPAPLDFLHAIPSVGETPADSGDALYHQYGTLLEHLAGLECSTRTIRIVR